MEPQNQNTTQPPRRSAVIEAITGGVIGALIGGITSLFNKKQTRTRQVTIGVVGGALLGLVMNLFAKKPEPTLSTPPALPPVLPPLAAQPPAGLALGTIPQLLDLMVAENILTREQQTQVLTDIKSGRQGFAGEMAVADGFITPAQLNATLAKQSMMKAEAAASDIQSIKDYGSLPAPTYLRVNWGNNGVNPAAATPNRTDGISAAANAAQNLVMIANANPALAPQLFNGVIAAASLANGIANGDSAVTPLAKMSTAWQQTMNDALKLAAQAHPQLVVDTHGRPIDINTYITARNTEVAAAVQQTLAAGIQRNPGQGR